ncbi:MAG: hypothetical protein COA77_03305 [Thaumarchaeota archaeon]|nr:MAG: hypothetical protein COA77_03305 [Nitrososphaerota archaeon]
MTKLTFLDNIYGIHKKNLNSSQSKIFSFNITVHKTLEKEKITHEIAETYLSSDDRLKIYDFTLNLYRWYDDDSISKQIEFENVNLLELLDTAELHHLLITNLFNFLLIKRILEKEKPTKIFVTNTLSKIIRALTKDQKINIHVIGHNEKYRLPWDKIQIKFNIGFIPISFHIGRKYYQNFVYLLESILTKFLKLSFKFDNKKNTILLLEFDPSQYDDLLYHLGTHNVNILILNRRRTSLWSIKSIKSLLNSGSKILDFQKIISKNEKEKILSVTQTSNEKLEYLFSDDVIFNTIFCMEGVSFWSCIKDTLIETYKKRFHEYISLLVASKNIVKQSNLSCVIGLNVVGETEKSFLAINKHQIPFVLLEHGFANHTPELKKFDIFHMYSLLKDQIAVWGDIQKNYLLTQHQFNPDKILVSGSPRHDSFFNRQLSPMQQKKIILITPHPITNLSAFGDTHLYLRLENFLRSFYNVVKKIPNVEVVVKLHPGQDEYESFMTDVFHDIDPKIPIYHVKPIIDLIDSCNVLVNISPESFDTSTVMLEGLVMKKPVVNIVLDDKSYDFQFDKDNAILSISDKEPIDKILNDVLFNDDFCSKLIANGQIFLKKYLVNHGSASESLANNITSF